MTNTREEAAEKSLQNAQNSPLLRLPPKIRNMIFGYIFSGYIMQPEFNISSHKLCLRVGEHAGLWYRPSQIQLMALTSTCMQLHRETALLPFQRLTFSMHLHGAFSAMLSMISPAQLSSIRAIRIHAADVFIGCSRNGDIASFGLLEEITLRTNGTLCASLRLLSGLKSVLIDHVGVDYGHKLCLQAQDTFEDAIAGVVGPINEKIFYESRKGRKVLLEDDE